MAKLTDIQKVLVELAQPGMSSKTLRKETERAFPKASKKELRLAAFAAMIAIVDSSPDQAVQLQDLALGPAGGTSS